MSKKVTIADIARQSGLSGSTVSRVINNSPTVDSSTRRKILDVIKRAGYAKSSGQKTICVISHGICMHERMMLNALLQYARERNYRLELILPSDLDLLNERVVCGVINMAFSMPDLETYWHEKTLLPLVCLFRESVAGYDNIAYINGDGIGAMQACIDHLWEKGHREIGLLSDMSEEKELTVASGRYQGFCQTLEKKGITDPKRNANFAATEKLRDGLERLLKNGCTALICVNPQYGPCVVNMLYLLGKKIPRDISVITWENEDVTEFMFPPLTSCAADYDAIARKALDLLEAIRAKRPFPLETVLPFRLIKRSSVACPRSGRNKLRVGIIEFLLKGPLSRRELATELDIAPNNGCFLRLLRKMREEKILDFTNKTSSRAPNQKICLLR